MKRRGGPAKKRPLWKLLFVSIFSFFILVCITAIVVYGNLDFRAQATGNAAMCENLCQRICVQRSSSTNRIQNDDCSARCTLMCTQFASRYRSSRPNTTSVTITPTPSIAPPSQAQTPSPTTVVSGTAPQTPSTEASIHWHALGTHDGLNVHEHGDKPPDWADSFSQRSFGHPVIFSGDEATPNENALKHQAYKGFFMRASGVDIFIRYHSMSAPTDRSGPLHSYEVYAKDGSGNISFWQGWIFHGYPEHRDQRMSRHNEQPGFDSVNGINWPGRSQFIIAGADTVDWEKFLRCEQWYGHAGLWSWDLSITICGATTYYSVDEHLGDIYNQSTWHPTGSLGGSRRLEVSHYGPTNPRVGGANLPFDKWFCVKKLPNETRSSGRTPTWDVGVAVSGPTACQNGWLPQYVASTFPKVGVYFETGNTAEKSFPVPGVTIPN